MNDKKARLEDIDVIIVSVLIDTEHPALLATFGIEPFSKPDEQHDNFKFWFTELETINGKHLKVALTCFSDKGNIASSLFTKKILEITKPKRIYLVGTAAGRKDRVSICDVVVSSEGIMYYEPGRGEGSKPEFVFPKQSTKSEVKFHYTSRMKSLNWLDEYWTISKKYGEHFHLPSPTEEPEVHFEIIASGEKLLDKEKFKSICNRHDSVYAGEMEGYGFAKVCDDSNTDWLVIRGVSDFGERREREQWKMVATIRSCSFLKIFLKYAYIPPKEIKRLSPLSLYVREKIPDIMRKVLEEKSIDISSIKFSLDLTINDLERITHILYPYTPLEKLRNIIREARAIAFEKKYADRTQEQDERFLSIESWRAEVQRLFHHLNIINLNNLRVIDVGIGNGLETEGLLDNIEDFTAVDISQKSLAFAKQRCPKMKDIVNDAEDLCNVENSSQDIYISFRTYTATLFDVKDALFEAYRVLRSGGIIIISIPYIFFDEEKGELIKGLLLHESEEVDPNLPYMFVDKVRKGLDLLNFDRIGIYTGMFEIYVYGQKGR